jgi:hypothetical protein
MLSPATLSRYFGVKNLPGDRDSGENFDAHPDYLFPVPVSKIMKISIASDNVTVHAIQMEYLLLDGKIVPGEWHGQNFTGTIYTISLKSEILIGIEGELNELGDQIIQMAFITWDWKSGGITRHYHGPYGSAKKWARPIAVYGNNILGFYGNVGVYCLFGISVYYDEW